MNVLVLHDDVLGRPTATADELGVLESVDAVLGVLGTAGHRAAPLPVGPSVEWLRRLERARPDVVFNLCEGVGGRADHEAGVAAAVELLGVSMTGAPSECLSLARRKDRVNALLGAGGLRVPAWLLVPEHGGTEAVAAWTVFPAIVKPAGEDGSVGITQASVVRDGDELRRAIGRAARQGPLLVQEFVGDRELVVGIVGSRTLPVAEIDFSALPEGLSPMVSYAAKWAAGSPEDRGTTPICPAAVDPDVRERASGWAAAAWRLVGGRGYGRVDFRLGRDGSLHVLEVNPNPDLAPAAGLARMAAAGGWSYRGLIEEILAQALAGSPAADRGKVA